MPDELLQTACHPWHVQQSARMVDFGGWSMPIQYRSIVEEHHAVRRAAGLFDIAHMGRLRFTGPNAARLLDRLVTSDVAGLAPGQVRYGLITNTRGGILDDVLVYRLPNTYLMVVNASNRLKIIDWIQSNREGFDGQMTDLTHDWWMCALQGPRAEEVLAPLVEIDLKGLRYYYAAETHTGGAQAIVSRTGYTGEDGFELIVPADEGLSLWQRLLDRGAALGLLPSGLGARDTLRLEAGMPLYGHELTEEINPFEAQLGFAVKLDKEDLVGQAELKQAKQDPEQWRRVGLELHGRRIAREGFTVLDGGTPVGYVTSGTFSPTLEKSIAMAYVEPSHASAGTPLLVDIRSRRVPAVVVKLPFYKRPKG